MNKGLTTIGAAAGAAALTAAVMGGISLANAQDTRNGTPTGTGGWARGMGPGGMGPGGMHPAEVTGDAATKAGDAAKQAVADADVDHIFARPDGGYTVIMEKSDGSHVAVRLDKDFAVVDVDTDPVGPGKGPGGMGPGGMHPAEVTGEAADKATAAAKEKLPNATVDHVVKRPDGGYAVMTHLASGARRIVLLDDSFTLEKVISAPAGDRGRMRGKDLTGAAKRKAERAAKKAVPAGTVMGSHREPGGYDVLVRTDNGMVRIELNKRFKVVHKDELNGFGPGPGMGGPGHGMGGNGGSSGQTA